VVAVNEGEQISQYQALQALLVPSANNMADTLVRWAFGSVGAYLAYANNMAKGFGMDSTHFADASGFSEQSVASATDLVRLGLVAMQNPVFAEIVARPQASIPVAGEVSNVNQIVGSNGIIGIKTGNTDLAGGCYLVAAAHDFGGGNTVVLVAAILAAPNLGRAMSDSLPLLTSAYAGFGTAEVVKKGQQVGYYQVPWQGNVAIFAQTSLYAFGWEGETLIPEVTIAQLRLPANANVEVGDVRANGQKATLSTQATVSSPSILWRLEHAF
jgi:D-alanyl-D-alanine carboxypeptidase (penicillin-binding protein 5/6)